MRIKGLETLTENVPFQIMLDAAKCALRKHITKRSKEKCVK